jgi:hypothetical protein
MLSGVTTLYISGHSLGSAVATLCVPVAVSLGMSSGLQCNQASPKVGDAAFAKYIDGLPIETYRLVNTYDAVPKAPVNPLYVHVGTEVYFGADYKNEAQKHNPCCSYSYALANPANPVNPDIQSCVKTVPLTPEGDLS